MVEKRGEKRKEKQRKGERKRWGKLDNTDRESLKEK